ncbi:hypothetical protein D3C79_949300 [compost metagenome]
MARAPETPIMLAKAKPAVGMHRVSSSSREPSSVALIITWAMRPSTAPNRMPPRASCRNRPATLPKVGSTPPKATAKTVAKITRPTPSLNRDSPSIWMAIWGGAFIFLTMASTAMGSVGEIRAPNSMQ